MSEPSPDRSEGGKDPMRAAQANMRPPPVGRFYKAVEVREADGRHALLLDGRGARTPGRNPLSATSQPLMLKVAEEWERQHETIVPADMPLTRLLNSAIDGVAHTMAETRADILSYAGSDLLCYRAEEPDTLVARQAHAFDPVLRWAAEVARGALQCDNWRDACRAAARGAGGDWRSARRVRRSRCAGGAQRDDDADADRRCSHSRSRAASFARSGVAKRRMSTRTSRPSAGARMRRPWRGGRRAGASSRRLRRR